MNSNELVKDVELAKEISDKSMDFTRTLNDVTNDLVDIIDSIRQMYILYGMKEEDSDRKELNDTDDLLGKALDYIDAAQESLTLVRQYEWRRQQRNRLEIG